MSARPFPKLKPGGWDLLVAACVAAAALACAAVFWLGPAQDQGALTAVVSVDGEEVERIAVSDPAPIQRTYHANGYTLYVTAGDGQVQVTQADCPTQDCVHTGAISRAGQSIVCLPARVVIALEGTGGADSSDVDLVIG
jgi:hypothetical protein